MLVHFEDAFVALGAMVGSVRLGSQASCAHSDATKLFALEGLHLKHGFFWFFYKFFVFLIIDGSSLAFDEPIIEMTWLFGILLVL